VDYSLWAPPCRDPLVRRAPGPHYARPPTVTAQYLRYPGHNGTQQIIGILFVWVLNPHEKLTL